MNALKFTAVLGLLILTQTGGADPLDTWTLRNPEPTQFPLTGTAFGNGQFVAVGNGISGSKALLTSTDGANWTEHQVDWFGKEDSAYMYGGGVRIIYANGTFVATVHALDTGAIFSSPNGLNWTVAWGGNNLLGSIGYGNKTLVAVGERGTVLTSADATHWTWHQVGIEGTLRAVTYGNQQFVAVGDKGAIATSAEGTNWSRHLLGAAGLNGISYCRGKFVAVGDAGTIVTSADGVNWVQRPSGVQTALYAIAHGSGRFVAVGEAGTTVTSSDGVIWRQRSSATPNDLLGIAYGDGHFVAVGAYGTILESQSIIDLILTPNSNTGPLSLSLEGPPGLDYTIQTSTDLITWRDVTKVTNAQSSKVILDGLPAASGHQFYRAFSQ